MSDAATNALYSARQITEEHEAGKWAVFNGDKQVTRGGDESAARSWANFMNRTDARKKGQP